MSRQVTAGDRRGWQSPAVTPHRVGGRPGAGPGTGRGQRGAVTAEAAVVLPVLVAVTLGLVWVIAVAVTHVRVVDAARETARSAARGDGDAVAVAAGRAVAPRATAIDIRRDGQVVRVDARVEVDGPGGLFRLLPGVEVHSRAVATIEPGGAP